MKKPISVRFWGNLYARKMLGTLTHSESGSQSAGATRIRSLIGVAACMGLLSACVMAPGMRMESPKVPVNSGDASVPPISVPITEIDLNLIKQLRAGSAETESRLMSSLVSEPQPYVLGPGDVLQITVWDHPEIAAALGAQPQTAPRPFDPAQGFVIDDHGDLQFPYAGSFHATGMTVAQVQQHLLELLSMPGRFANPQVTVRVASFRANQVYVDGEVRTPGGVPITDIPTTVYEAINRAGGFTANADESRLEQNRP
jgi:polysaccharide biosynthesis/export protein